MSKRLFSIKNDIVISKKLGAPTAFEECRDEVDKKQCKYWEMIQKQEQSHVKKIKKGGRSTGAITLFLCGCLE